MKKYLSSEMKRDNEYEALLNYLLQNCDRFETIIRTDIISDETTDDKLNQALNELQPFLVNKIQGTEWHVNEISEGSVEIYSISLTAKNFLFFYLIQIVLPIGKHRIFLKIFHFLDLIAISIY